jgi:hypothetical protein
MATSAQTLVDRTRRYLRDWPQEDVLTASVASNSVTLTVETGTLYADNWVIEIDSEELFVNGNGSGSSVTVRRGARGSTAASHASGATVLMRPSFFQNEILDALNAGLDACFPLLYRPVALEYTGISDTVYEYTIPSMSGISVAIPFISEIDVKEPGDLAFRQNGSWRIVRSEAPFIKFRSPPIAGSTIRISGYGPFTHLSALNDTLDTYFPVQGEHLLPLFAAAHLLASGEAGRLRSDTGAQDTRESANTAGSSLRASQSLLQRFYTLLSQAAMPPPSKHLRNF